MMPWSTVVYTTLGLVQQQDNQLGEMFIHNAVSLKTCIVVQ